MAGSDGNGSLSRAERIAQQRRGLPDSPGVYLFCDDSSRVLYVGTSRDLRTRVRSYFTASETRSRMGEMVSETTMEVPSLRSRVVS